MRTLLTLALGMLVASTALAQPAMKKNELFVGIGDASLMFTFEDLVVTIASLGAVHYSDAEGGLQVVGGYQRRFNDWFSAGVTGSWASATRTMYVLDEDRGDVERRLITVMGDARAHWLRRPSVDLYSGLALGYAQWTDEWDASDHTADDGMAAFHIIPVGVRVGRDLGVFAEIGVGWHNILKAGLSGRW